MERRSLTGEWAVREAEDSPSRPDGPDRIEEWLPATVPGGIYSDLTAVDVIPDPTVADNELDVQWVGKTDWEYRHRFVGEALATHSAVTLECHGLDTITEIELNDTLIGQTENAHRRYEFDVTDAIEDGENELLVRFRSPVEYAAEREAAYPTDPPVTHYPVDQPHRNFVRKTQCHFGWDWGPCLPTMGIWRDIEVVGHDGPRIREITPVQHHHDDGVDLQVRVALDSRVQTDCELAVSVAGAASSRSATVAAGESTVDLELSVDDPELWWPRGQGDQPLYDLRVEVRSDRGRTDATRRIGFREVELDRSPEPVGQRFAIRVNGEPIFLKGANWIPADAMYRDWTEERYDDLLESAAGANMNAVRVWGGGAYERPHFYERCDELGLLVWQDFMFACAAYPADDAFVRNVEAEARDHVRRLASHPSVALWCGNNECETAVMGWFSGHEDHDRLRADYDRLFHDLLPGVVAEEDPATPYWPSSPSNGGEGDPDEPWIGDSHYWAVWHGGDQFESYRDVTPRMASEFGYQSFASTDTLSTVLESDQFNPTAPLMEHHQRHPEGNALILRQLAEHFRFPDDFEDFVYISQLLQGLAMKTGIEAWRRDKPGCWGTLYWQLNDVWPGATWSSIEHGGRWKALHHLARRFYAPVLPSAVEVDPGRGETDSGAAQEDVEGAWAGGSSDDADGGALAVYLTSDLPEPTNGTVSVTTHDLRGGVVSQRSLDVTLETNESAEIATLDVDTLLSGLPRERAMIRLDYDGPGESYSNDWFGVRFKQLDLARASLDISISVEETAVTVAAPADAPALFVTLDAPGARFSDNFFHLHPGESRTLAVEAGTLDPDALDVTHLRQTY